MTGSSAGVVLDEVSVDRSNARIYAEGWQSWSPTTWYPVGVAGLRPDEPSQHTMRFRPGTPLALGGVQAEGLLVVDPGTGDPACCYGARSGTRVPTLHAATENDRVVVRVLEGAQEDLEVSQHGDGGEAALAAYAETLVARAGLPAPQQSPSVWCSWYQYFEKVTPGDVQENLAALRTFDLAVDVVQIDDGWSLGLGENLRPTRGFEALPSLVDAIRASGRRAGIWLAPFLVGRDTTLAAEHPDWLLGDAGRNWGQDLVGLDLTHPGVRDLLTSHLSTLRDLGVDYLKLDFLYAGAAPRNRHDDVSGIDAYRSGLQLIRDVMGPQAYLVGCGAPILPSVGLVDAMRVSPDTFHEGGEDGSAGLRGLMPLAARTWQQGRFWANDPDCLVARPSYALREQWAPRVLELGGLRTCSDRISELDDWGLETTRRLLATPATGAPFDLDRVRAGAELAAAELSVCLATERRA